MALRTWNSGFCMASSGKKSKRCGHPISKGGDFCRYHKHHHRYSEALLQKRRKLDRRNFKLTASHLDHLKRRLNQVELTPITSTYLDRSLRLQTQLLDEKHIDQLMFIQSSWKEIPLVHRLKTSGGWWDMKSLISHLTCSLNNSDMNNPKPIYPVHPFIRKPLSHELMNELCLYLRIINEPIPISLFVFLMIHCPSANESIFETFDYWLRYRLINRADSQGCFQGFWVYKFMEKTPFELLYHEWYDMPLQRLIVNDEGMYEAIENQQRNIMKQILDNSPAENLSALTDSGAMSIDDFLDFFQLRADHGQK